MLQEGILNASRDWDEIKSEYDPELTSGKQGKGYTVWKAPAYIPKHKKTVSLITNAVLKLPKAIPQAFSVAEKLRPTAYLDGLRGFAAFLVYWHHHELWSHGADNQLPIFENGFGYEGKYHLIAFPFIRNFFSGGHYSVSAFFIISGYVLSLKPLGLLQAGEYSKLSENLACAMFKRWPRLYIPLILVLLVYTMSWHMTGMWINGVKKQGTWHEEIWAFYLEFKNFSFVFKEGGTPWLSYNFHLWSIPVEFKGSMVVFTTLLALSRSAKAARLWCEALLIFYFMYVSDGWYCCMFLTGMMLCDLDLLAKKNELPRFLTRLEPYKEFIFYHLFVISFYLGGVPSQNSDVENLKKSRGWYYLAWFKPQAVFDYKWFYLWIAATLLVASIPRIHWLKRFFETKFCQYLGRISFALYMIHGPVLWMLGDRMYAAVGYQTDDHRANIPHLVNKFPLPKAGPLGLEVSFLLPQLILLPLTVVLAELITRYVDTPSVTFTSWLYRKTLGGEPMLGKQTKL